MYLLIKLNIMTKIKNILTVLSVMVLLSGTCYADTTSLNTAVAGDPVANSSAEPLSVQYIGQDENYLIFQVTVKSGGFQMVSFALNDRAEGELYTSVFTSDKVQTFKIEKRENQELNFNLQVGKKTFSRYFTSTGTQQIVYVN